MQFIANALRPSYLFILAQQGVLIHHIILLCQFDESESTQNQIEREDSSRECHLSWLLNYRAYLGPHRLAALASGGSLRHGVRLDILTRI